jgi:hypothetical protein
MWKTSNAASVQDDLQWGYYYYTYASLYAQTVVVHWTVDNSGQLFVNGRLLAGSNEWSVCTTTTVRLVAGNNYFQLDARNRAELAGAFLAVYAPADTAIATPLLGSGGAGASQSANRWSWMVDPLSATSCANGGACAYNSGATQAVCTCAVGWTGADCRTVWCNPVCANGGTCTTSTANTAPTCTCTAAWSGPACTTANIPACTPSGSLIPFIPSPVWGGPAVVLGPLKMAPWSSQ